MKTAGFRRTALCGAAGAMALASGAVADTAPGVGSTAVQEIIVTAQRRAERLQDVPLSVTALSSQALANAGVTNTIDLALVTPGLRMDSQGLFVQPSIRGITTTLSSTSAEANVATYVDGAYQQTMAGSIYDLPDVESVQVLKGPQGTLFGRNATGGAILINTVKPDLVAPRGMASVSYGNYGSVVTKGYFTVPVIADKLAVGLTGLYDHTDGWKHNLLDNNRREGGSINSYVLRGKVRFVPWEGADFTLTGLWTKRNDNNVLKDSNYLGNNISRLIDPTLPIASKPYQYATDVPQTVDTNKRAVTLHGDIKVGPGTFSTTSYYDKTRNNPVLDFDNGAAPLGKGLNPSYSRNYEQEFLYTTDQLGRFRAVGGVFLYSLASQTTFGLANNSFALAYRDKATSWAGFGEATYDLTDQFSLTGGLRYTSETRHSSATTVFGPISALPAFSSIGHHTWHALTPRVSALYKATQHTNVYATFSKGFTSGAYNGPGFQTDPVNPEHVKAFEAGVKSNEIANLSLSAAAFHYDYSNLQVYALSQIGQIYVQTLSNAAKAKISGAEVNATWRATANFDLTAGGTYLHARYSSFPSATVQVPTGLGGNLATPKDVSGNTMIRSPKWSGNLTGHYHLDTSRGAFDAAGTVFYTTRIEEDFSNRISQPAYAQVNATLSWQPAATHLKLSLWGKNLTNKAAITTTIIGSNYDAVEYSPPRTFGVMAQYTY